MEQTNIKITHIDRYTYNDSVLLLMRFYKEFNGETIHRIEAESILQDQKLSTIVLLIDGYVKGIYGYKSIKNFYAVDFFILDPLVRKKKKGYALWKDLKERLKDKPAIICHYKDNEFISSFLKKRGIYIGSGQDISNNIYDCYNINFKEF